MVKIIFFMLINGNGAQRFYHNFYILKIKIIVIFSKNNNLVERNIYI